MAPRKKTNSGSVSSSSKKSNGKDQQQSQPSKYGIQHFFERHTQNAALSDSQNAHNAKPPPPPPPPLQQPSALPNAAAKKTSHNSRKCDVFPNSVRSTNSPNLGNSDPGNVGPKVGSSDQVPVSRSRNMGSVAIGVSSNPSQITPPMNIQPIDIDSDDNEVEAPLDVPESIPVKRFKFSPGMLSLEFARYEGQLREEVHGDHHPRLGNVGRELLQAEHELIKQSQDDGGDEVTWKISPVNERLQMVSKHSRETIRALADASRLNGLNFRSCSQKRTSPDSEGKLEKWISSPMLKTTERSLILSNKVGFKRLKPDQDMDLSETAILTNSAEEVSEQSPFRTPPSLSYCQAKLDNDVACHGASDHMGFRQHKKALIELLDQVEGVISVEDSVAGNTEACISNCKDSNAREVENNGNLSVKEALDNLPEMKENAVFNPKFLVLEVSDNQKSTESQCPFKLLRLLDEQSGEEQAVFLRDEWFYSIVGPGDTIQVIGEFDDGGRCEVDRENNLLIVHPDLLLSGTRVASSFSCPRRTVLDERLKSSEHSTAALLGTLLHQVFQAGLTVEVPTKDMLEEYAGIVLQKNVESLYACGVNENDVYKTLVEAVPKMLNWITCFRDSQDINGSSVDFGSDNGTKKVTISEVIDIEEMVWAPKYGLKGMIDASVRVNFKSDNSEKIVPLEFKTGKATSGQSAMEHSAQVILYTLLMSERYLKRIDSGLLYYLHTDQTQGIEVRRSDLIGLIMRRNELANDILKASTTQQLPQMLQSPSMCKSCRHLNVCTIYHKAYGGDRESSGLGDIFDSRVHHITKTHSVFLQHWSSLIDLESKELQAANRSRRSHNQRSDRSPSCLASVVLDQSQKLPQQKSVKENKFIYRFVRQDSSSPDSKTSDGADTSASSSLDCTLKNGDYVILSTKLGNLAVASGVIKDISHHHISVSFSKRLRLPGSKSSSDAQDLFREVWQLNKDDFSSSFAIMRFNLVQLFLQNAQNSHLRKMIVDLEVPRFDGGCIFSQDPAISYIRSEVNMNNDQRRAILKILTAKNYALILGMPGTGKTSTMVHAVKALLMRGASVLLTSYTNSAVDNLLIKLKAQGIDFVRIGRHDAVHEEVQDHCISAMNMQSIEAIRVRLDQVKVVGVTCLGITSPLLVNKRFDICIMDEAGQTTLPVSLGPLMFASTFVLVGDHYQLPPLVQSAEARESGMGVSLFCRLSEAHPQAISVLQSQYRMCQGIMDLANTLIYGDRLRCGSSEIAHSTLKLSNSKYLIPWMEEVLEVKKPVIFINTDNLPAYEAKENKTVNNPVEALIVGKIIRELLNKGIEEGNIGIITPYNSQANIIRQAVPATSVEIHTIDKYQGRDKDCIIVSFVRSSEKPKHGTSSLLGDWHRINVALTRSKKKLIMVGSCKTLAKVPLLKLLIDKVHQQSGVLCVYKKDINLNGELRRCSQLTQC